MTEQEARDVLRHTLFLNTPMKSNYQRPAEDCYLTLDEVAAIERAIEALGEVGPLKESLAVVLAQRDDARASLDRFVEASRPR